MLSVMQNFSASLAMATSATSTVELIRFQECSKYCEADVAGISELKRKGLTLLGGPETSETLSDVLSLIASAMHCHITIARESLHTSYQSELAKILDPEASTDIVTTAEFKQRLLKSADTIAIARCFGPSDIVASMEERRAAFCKGMEASVAAAADIELTKALKAVENHFLAPKVQPKPKGKSASSVDSDLIAFVDVLAGGNFEDMVAFLSQEAAVPLWREGPAAVVKFKAIFESHTADFNVWMNSSGDEMILASTVCYDTCSTHLDSMFTWCASLSAAQVLSSGNADKAAFSAKLASKRLSFSQLPTWLQGCFMN